MESKDIFQRLSLLVGEETAAAYGALKVIVFGVGGVGSWCAEALARSGVGRLALVDGDVVQPSNVNRQLMATTKTIGEAKVETLAARLRDINPAAKIEAVRKVYTPENSDEFRLCDYDFVVDAIDDLKAKAHLINTVTRLDGPVVISSMGAACKADPFRIRTSEFWKVHGDGLARALRSAFRKSGVFPAKKFRVVWSDERLPNLGTPPDDAPRANGTLMHVTAAFGLALASLVLASAAHRP